MLLAWLVHPVTLGAVVLLAVNDHVLKAAYPGLLTGKLSDAAGLLVAPPVLALVVTPLLARWSPDITAGAALATTGVVFSLVKLTTAGAAVASAAWSLVTGPSVILADPTDLATLPVLGLCWWTWTRARQRPVSAAGARRFGTLVALPAATLALVATSAPGYPEAVAVTSWRDYIVIGDVDGYHHGWEPQSWRVSTDGRVWRPMTPEEQGEFEQVRDTLPLQAQQSCVPDQPARCYRVVPGHLRVEESTDGGATWSTSWQVPDDRRRYLARRYDGIHDAEAELASVALAVHPVAGGHVVIVANGRDGYARRDASGRWERIGFGGSEIGWAHFDDPPPLTGGLDTVTGELAVAFLVGLFVLAVGGLWAAAGVGEGRVAVASGITLLVGSPIAVIGALGLNSTDGSIAFMAWGTLVLGTVPMLVAAVIANGYAVSRAMTVSRATTVRSVGLILLAALGAGLGVAMPFIGWVNGICDHRTAVYVAVPIAVTGLVLAVHAGGHARPQPALVWDGS